MKYRIGFVTNSSSNWFLIRNLTNRTNRGIPPFETIEVGVEREGEFGELGGNHDYYGPDFLSAATEYVKKGDDRLILIDTDFDESKFRELFNTFSVLAQVEKPDVKEIEVDGISSNKDLYEYIADKADLSYIDRFSQLESLKVGHDGSLEVVGWNAVARCPKLKSVRYWSEEEPNFDELFRVSEALSRRGGAWSIEWCGFEWRNFFDTSDWSDSYNVLVDSLNRVPEKYWLFAQRDIITDTGLRGLEGYLGNPVDIVENINSKDLDEALSQIRNRIYDLLAVQIELGTSIMIDINQLSKTQEARLVPQILEDRRKEIMNTIVPTYDGKVNLRKLWTTAYGFQILKSLEYQLDTTLDEMDPLNDAFAEIGLELNIKESPNLWSFASEDFPENTPIGLQYFITYIVDSLERV